MKNHRKPGLGFVTNFRVLNSVFAILTLSLFATIAESDEGGQPKWEYQLLKFSELYRITSKEGKLKDVEGTLREKLPIMLNVQGELGWELCAFIEESDECFIFKRRKRKD